MALILIVLLLARPLPASPGSPDGVVNSFEGEIWMNGVPVSGIDSGRVTLQDGRGIRTVEGFAELLLTPGCFLRLATRSEVILKQMGTAQVRARVVSGEALLEVLYLETPIILEQNGGIAVIRTPGLYDFNQRRAFISVYSGEVQIDQGGKRVIAGKGISTGTRNLRESRMKPVPANALYFWSKNRDQLLSAESEAAARSYPGGQGNWQAPAWEWNPWSASYTFLSASGAVTGPFGWPYYSPEYARNYIPKHRSGNSSLYGAPVLSVPGPMQLPAPGRQGAPTVPLTAPGVPAFPRNLL
jgi:hypothetical protein